VHYLLKAGAGITAKDHKGRTPLHSCAEFAIEQHVWAPLEHGNDPAGQYNRDRFRPEVQMRQPNDQWYKSPLEDGHDMIPTHSEHDTARIGGIVKSLLSAGADVNATDSQKCTPLDLAISYRCHDMAKILWSETVLGKSQNHIDPTEVRLQTFVALNQRVPVISRQLPNIVTKEILQYPSRYLSMLDHQDVDWIANIWIA
jgi:ankyrin repeat protein